MKKVLTLIILNTLLAVCYGCAKEPEVHTSKPQQPPQQQGIYSQQQQEPDEVSDKLLNFQFSLDDVVYKLPCKLSTFEENGWAFENTELSSKDMIEPETSQGCNIKKNNSIITVVFRNYSKDKATLEDCVIDEVSFSTAGLNGMEAYVSKGITTASTVEEIEAAFGTKYETSDIPGIKPMIYVDVIENQIKGTVFGIYTDGSTNLNSITVGKVFGQLNQE